MRTVAVLCSQQRHAPRARPSLPAAGGHPAPRHRRVSRPRTAHSHVVICSFPGPQKTNCLFLKKEVTTQRGVGHLPLLGLCGALPPGSWSPVPPRVPIRPPTPTSQTQRLHSTHQRPLRSQEVCSLSASILGVWTQPWNFTGLGGPGRVSALSSAPTRRHPLCPRTPRGQLSQAGSGGRGEEQRPRAGG